MADERMMHDWWRPDAQGRWPNEAGWVDSQRVAGVTPTVLTPQLAAYLLRQLLSAKKDETCPKNQ